ncbi:MAG: NtaA/DmoA family FMN-dependent monooxygenase, partial [Caulobacterales bacterium]
FIRDKEKAVYYDPEKLHRLDHVGESYQVRGPLNVPRPIQGYPVLVQAGASDTGRDVGAAIADVIFVASPDIDDAKAFYNDVKGRAAALGRDVEQIKVLPGISPVIGRTEEEAYAKLAELDALVPDSIAFEGLWTQLGVNLSDHDPDGPLPEMQATNAKLSRQKLLAGIAKRDNLTIRQLARIVVSSRGFLSVVGTPETVADTMEKWLNEGAADGFNVMPPIMPGGLDDFVDLVVPILQERGIFRKEYEGKTLRENLGLKRPPNRFAIAREEAARALAATAPKKVAASG